VTQQARQLSWQVQDGAIAARYLLHDRDSKFVPGFDAVFRSEGVEVVRTLYQAPTANAVAERWVGSVRRECLDHLLIISETHLRHVVTVYVDYYNEARPHQGLDQRTPVPPAPGGGQGPIRRRDRLGGLLREYDRNAA
jgi:putative transposase